MDVKDRTLDFSKFKEHVFFYRVSEFVTTFKADPSKTEPLDYFQDFSGHDLVDSRMRAISYYIDRAKGFETANFFLPFASPNDFKLGVNSAYSITLTFVVKEYCVDGVVENEYYLFGGDQDEMEEAQEIELMVYRSKGICRPT